MNSGLLALGAVAALAVAQASRGGSRASEGEVDESISDRYGHGECHAFTRALAELFPGAEVYVITLDDTFRDDEVVHSMVRIEDRMLDAYGWGSRQDKLQIFDFLNTRGAKLEIRPATPRETGDILKTKGILDARAAARMMLQQLGPNGSAAKTSARRQAFITRKLRELTLDYLKREHRVPYLARVDRCAWDINCGDCEDWACEARGLLASYGIHGEVDWLDNMDSRFQVYNEELDEWTPTVAHAVLDVEGRFYDSQHPEGVDDLAELDIVKGVHRYEFLEKQRLREAESAKRRAKSRPAR